MAIRINWPQIKDQLGVSVDTPFLFVLPNAGRQLLLSVANRLEWEASFRGENYNYDDWDSLQTIVSSTQYGLINGVNMHELINALTLIADAVSDIRVSLNNTVSCCDNPQTVQTEDNGTVLDVGTVPEVYGNVPTATWTDYNALVCGAAHAWVAGMVNVITRFSEALDNGLLVAAGLAGLLALMAIGGILIPIEFGLAFGLFSTLVALLTSEPLDDLILYLQDNEVRIANRIYCAGNATIAASELRTMLESELTAVQWNLVRYFDIESAMAVIFSGVNSEGEALDVSPDSSCSCAAPGADWEFDVDREDWFRGDGAEPWRDTDGSPDIGCLFASFSTYLCSPPVEVGSSGIRFTFEVKKPVGSGTPTTARVELVNPTTLANDIGLIYGYDINYAWQSVDTGAVFSAAPAGTYRLKFTQDASINIDTVDIV